MVTIHADWKEPELTLRIAAEPELRPSFACMNRHFICNGFTTVSRRPSKPPPSPDFAANENNVQEAGPKKKV
jgi:hypothetical protein